MAKLRWIPDGPDQVRCAEQIMRDLINRAGGLDVAGTALYRKNDGGWRTLRAITYVNCGFAPSRADH